METVTLDVVYKEIKDLKGEMLHLKHLMEEDYELSNWAKDELKKARKEMKSKTISHEEIMRKYA